MVELPRATDRFGVVLREGSMPLLLFLVNLSLFTTSAVIPVVPDLSLIASLNAVISLTAEMLVVVIVAEFEVEVSVPITKLTFPVE